MLPVRVKDEAFWTKRCKIGIDRAPSPVRVEGEAQGVAAPQHQLADLVDVDVKFESTTKTTGFSYEYWRLCPKLITLPKYPLGTGDGAKTDEFLEKFQRGGIFIQKIYVADIGPFTGF